AAAIAAHLFDPRLGAGAVGAYRRLLRAREADQPARRRPVVSQSRRVPNRDFQASEGAVMDEPRFDPLDYVSVLGRRKWWFIVPVVLAIFAGTLAVWKLPRSYQATATIAVSASRVAPSLIGATEIDKQDRMRAVSQQLMSRPVLERTVRLEHLDRN